MGSVDFVDDMTSWLGVELDTALGRHDGTVQVGTLSRVTCHVSITTSRVQGVRYFAAARDCGVFVTADRVTKLGQVCT